MESRNILIASPDTAVMELAAHSLKQHNIIHCGEEQEMLKMIEKANIHVMLFDADRTIGDRLHLMRHLHARGNAASIPIIVVVDCMQVDPIWLKQMSDAGAFDYVCKPIKSFELLARISVALRYRDMRDLYFKHSTRDDLTKLYNNTYFKKALRETLNQVEQFPKGMALVMIDCDQFKRVNDRFGHLYGDHTLIGIANMIFDSTNNQGIVCRYGGDEFAIIFPNICRQHALAVCELIRANISNNQCLAQHVFPTVSIGLSHVTKEVAISYQGLIIQADTALRLAKRKGRNRIEYLSC